jgi:O-antigen/teichoic acid export membrane protein
MVCAETQPGQMNSSVAVEPQIQHALLLTASPLLKRLLRMTFVIVVARALGPRLFGSYGLLLAVVEMIAVISGSGYLDYLTREAAKDAASAWGTALQLTLLRSLYVLAFSVVGITVLWALGSNRGVLLVGVAFCVAIIPRAASEAIQGVLRGIGRFASFLAIDVVTGVVLALGGIGILVWPSMRSLSATIAVELASATVGCALALLLWLPYRAGAIQWSTWPQLLARSYVFNIYELVVNLYDRLDVVLLAKLAGDYAAGIYTVAYRAMNTVQIIPYGVFFSLMPVFSRGDWGHTNQRQLDRALGLMVSVALAAGVATLAFVTPATSLLLGPKYLESATALKILIWAEILMCVNYGLNIALLARGHERIFMRTSLVCLIVNIVGNLLLIPKFSWRAAALMTIVTEVALLVQNIFWIRRLVGTTPKPYGALRAVVMCAVFTCAMLLARTVVLQAVLGTVGLGVFITYLVWTGMFGEFRRTWATRFALE